MNHTENAYVQAGYKYEKAKSSEAARAQANLIRAMLSSERPEDQTYARELIEQGRQEARQ